MKQDAKHVMPYYLDQEGWGKDDYYCLHRYLHRMIYYYPKRMEEIKKIELEKTTEKTRVLLYCIIRYYHYGFLLDLDNLKQLKSTKPLNEALVIDGDTACDDDIYREMNVVF